MSDDEMNYTPAPREPSLTLLFTQSDLDAAVEKGIREARTEFIGALERGTEKATAAQSDVVVAFLNAVRDEMLAVINSKAKGGGKG